MPAQLTPREIREIVRRIATITHPERVIMFGSYAKGRASARSDLDLLVVLPTESPIQWRVCDLRPHLQGSIIPVDVHIVTADEFDNYSRQPHHFLHSIRHTGRLLYTTQTNHNTSHPDPPAIQCIPHANDDNRQQISQRESRRMVDETDAAALRSRFFAAGESRDGVLDDFVEIRTQLGLQPAIRRALPNSVTTYPTNAASSSDEAQAGQPRTRPG